MQSGVDTPAFLSRAVQAGVQATLMVVVTGIFFVALPGREMLVLDLFGAVLATAAVGSALIWLAPWGWLIERGKAMAIFYLWSGSNIWLITLAIVADGGSTSDLYIFYALTTVFFTVVYRPVAQVFFFLMTILSYVSALGLMKSPISPSQLQLRIAFIGILTFLGSFLAREMRRQMEARRMQALHDPMTDLPNRLLLRDRVSLSLANAARQGESVMLFLVDIERLREINETLGHSHGDHVVAEAAKRLSGLVRGGDTVARVAGDEFALLLTGVRSHDLGDEVARRVLECFEVPFVVDNLPLEIDCNIGVAIYPDHGTDADELLQRADVALNLAKEGQGQLTVYSPAQDQHSTRRLMIMTDLRAAVARNQMSVNYQPIIELATGEVVGAEALVRWTHPKLGMVPPGEFIPLAEQSGAIRHITHFVLDESLAQMRDFERSGLQLMIAINLSQRDLQEPSLPELVAEALTKWGRHADTLELELTEHTLMTDPERGVALLNRLKETGVRIALDDFGTGYSSLAQLSRMPVDCVKIDRSFVAAMQASERDAGLVLGIVELAHTLGMSVVAEGVETEDALRELSAMGCERAQGYFIAKPMGRDDFATFIHRRQAAASPA